MIEVVENVFTLTVRVLTQTAKFFVTNLMLNIFMLNNFFGKLLFSEETAKNRSVDAYLGEPE